MANEEHLKILNQGVEAWNEWREKNPAITPDLNKANLIMADLSGANLNKAVLIGADLIMTNLSGANLILADLSGADLCEADLNKAVLIAADLYKADLTGAQDLTAKQLITTINWQEAILDSSLRVEAEKLSGAENR